MNSTERCGRCDEPLSTHTNVCLHCGYDLGDRLIEIDNGLRQRAAARQRFRHLTMVSWVAAVFPSQDRSPLGMPPAGDPSESLTAVHGAALIMALGIAGFWYLSMHANLHGGWRALVIGTAILNGALIFTKRLDVDLKRLIVGAMSLIVAMAGLLHYLFTF